MPENHAFIETAGKGIGIRTLSHLYGLMLQDDDRTIVDSPFMFYDLRSDPYQQDNLSAHRCASQEPLACDLRKLLEAWHRNTPWMEG